jgi:LuxR family quorum sensing-dependent transcriptional regulator
MTKTSRDSRNQTSPTPQARSVTAGGARKHVARPITNPLDLFREGGASRHPTPFSLATFCHRVLGAKDREALADLTESWLRPFGFAGFSFGETRRVNDSFVDDVQLVRWDRELATRFIESGLYRHDPVLLRFLVSTETFTWDLSLFDDDNPQHRDLRAIRERAGAVEGVVAIACGPFPTRFSLFASGRNVDRSDRMTEALTVAAGIIAMQVNRFDQEGRPQAKRPRLQMGPSLSAREREVIRWAAAGKSSRETAVILSISEHTVNEYISGAIQKLNVANRTEAVAHAILTNQVSLA